MVAVAVPWPGSQRPAALFRDGDLHVFRCGNGRSFPSFISIDGRVSCLIGNEEEIKGTNRPHGDQCRSTDAQHVAGHRWPAGRVVKEKGWVPPTGVRQATRDRGRRNRPAPDPGAFFSSLCSAMASGTRGRERFSARAHVRRLVAASSPAKSSQSQLPFSTEHVYSNQEEGIEF